MSLTNDNLFQDKNDNAPIFTSVVRPITIEDSSSIGSLVQTVTAVDSDSTAANNRVRYKLVGRGKASKYFNVEPDTGAVRVRDDLRKETDSEYTVRISGLRYKTDDLKCSVVRSICFYIYSLSKFKITLFLGGRPSIRSRRTHDVFRYQSDCLR